MSLEEKADLILSDIKKEKGTNPVQIFKRIAEKEYISIHGPEHHILDGASLLMALKNAGVIISGLSEPPVRTLRATIPENESHIFR